MFARIYFCDLKMFANLAKIRPPANIKEFIAYITMAYIVSMAEGYGYNS